MNRIANILVPVDFSDASRNAMRHAIALASKFGSTLTAAHIVPSFTAFTYAFPDDTGEFEKRAFNEARKLLPQEIPAAFRDRLHTHSVVKSGDVRDELLGIVTEEKADLVVMGTHGRRGVKRFFLGSTTENLLRRIPVPILTVSDRGADKAESPFDPLFKRILYASDLSETGTTGLRYCAQFAKTLGAHLSVVHVMELRDPLAFDDKSVVRAHSQERLNSVLAASGCDRMDVTSEIIEGKPHVEVLKYAERFSADLIVLNLHGHGFLERAILGSMAERVIRSATIPVLSLPPERESS